MSQSIKPPVTVRDIALATGLHHTTISLGLRNSPKLRPETLKKIQSAAKRLGYVPDPMLSALNAYRQGKRAPRYQATMAWINNWPDPGRVTVDCDVSPILRRGARSREAARLHHRGILAGQAGDESRANGGHPARAQHSGPADGTTPRRTRVAVAARLQPLLRGGIRLLDSAAGAQRRDQPSLSLDQPAAGEIARAGPTAASA